MTIYKLTKTFVTILISIIFSNLLYSQSVTILGKVIYPVDSSSLGYTQVYFDLINSTYCDKFGNFSLTIGKNEIRDTLKFKNLGYRHLYINNIPTDVDTIILGEIPMFRDTFPNLPLVDFMCRWFDFKCKRHVKLFWRKVEKENNELLVKINFDVETYIFIYNNQKFKIETCNSFNDLTLKINLGKPYN